MSLPGRALTKVEAPPPGVAPAGGGNAMRIRCPTVFWSAFGVATISWAIAGIVTAEQSSPPKAPEASAAGSVSMSSSAAKTAMSAGGSELTCWSRLALIGG